MSTYKKLRAAALAALSLAAAATSLHSAPQAAAKPNVLFIIFDDLAPRLNCYGETEMITPNIDRLARAGRVFYNAYCQFSLCGPSRASFLSGMRPDSTRCFNNSSLTLRKNVGDQLVTLPQLFKNNGYESVSVGKVFHHSKTQPGEDEPSWSRRPFYATDAATYRHYHNKETLDAIAALKKQAAVKNLRGFSHEIGQNTTDDDYPDGLVVQKMISTLRDLKDAGKPFFFAAGFQKPHLPFVCPKKYWDMYPEEKNPPKNTPPPRNANPFMTTDSGELRTYCDVPKEGPLPEQLQKNLTRGYKACVSFADAQLGKLLDEFEKLGLADNTIIVFIGDNGYHFGDNGTWGKLTNFEQATRVPMIISAPKMNAAGKPTKGIVEFIDIAPTLAELAGLTPPKNFEGKSLVPLLDNPALPGKDAACSQVERDSKTMGWTVRTAGYRYVEWRKRKSKNEKHTEVVAVELYDETKDPHETENIADLPACKKIRAQLAAKLTR